MAFSASGLWLWEIHFSFCVYCRVWDQILDLIVSCTALLFDKYLASTIDSRSVSITLH